MENRHMAPPEQMLSLDNLLPEEREEKIIGDRIEAVVQLTQEAGAFTGHREYTGRFRFARVLIFPNTKTHDNVR